MQYYMHFTYRISLSSLEFIKLLLKCRLDKDSNKSRGRKPDSTKVKWCTIVVHIYKEAPVEASPQGLS